ncbi:HNH endonuclease [Phormidesmis sp. 146-33]
MPMQRDLYPIDWEAIALDIKERARWTCGECGQECRKTGELWADFFDRTCWSLAQNQKWGHYTLTVAHLDQNPSNNDPSNLKALCTVYHLKHDRPYRIMNRYAKREQKGQLTLDLKGVETDGL